MPKSLSDEIKRQGEKALRDVFHKKLKAGQIHRGLLSATGQCLETAMSGGYGKVDWDTPDGAMYQSLRQNVWHFAAAKNYQQIKDLSGLLIETTKQGDRVRSFTEFREAAEKANAKFNEKWLQTEYNQAINGATMAARWVEYQKNADIMPMLKYVTVGDQNVRDEHALLDGTKRPIDDAWWNSYYPPNGWGCRCDVQQMSSTAAKPTKDPVKISLPEIFKTNLAKDGVVFPEGSAYFNGVPKSVIKRSIANIPNAYKRVKGTNINVHVLQGDAEVVNNIQVARILDKQGHKVTLLPELGQADDKLREKLYGTKNFVKGRNPDALVDGVLFDFTNFEESSYESFNNKIKEKCIKKSTRQAYNFVIRLKKETDFKSVIDRRLKGAFNQSKSLQSIWIIDTNGGITYIDKKRYYK